MSHELRTPLNAILGYSEMLQEEATERHLAGEFGSDLEKINSAGKHLLTLINDILDLSKIEAGKMDLYLESFDLTEMIDDVASTIRPMVEKNANTLQIQRAPDLGAMHADQIKVRQALFNLLSNAVKFYSFGIRRVRRCKPLGSAPVEAGRPLLDERHRRALVVVGLECADHVQRLASSTSDSEPRRPTSCRLRFM